MKKIVFIFSMILLLTACTGSSDSGSQHGSKQPKREHELRFLRDMGINPDSMLIDDRWVMPDAEDWETLHNRWLSMEKIQSLGLDQLFEADTSMSPVTIIAVKPVDEFHTIIFFHQYLGDSAPLRLVTYDSDGIPIDHLNLGTVNGPNLRYWDDNQNPTKGVETANITFADRLMTVERDLQLLNKNNEPVSTATNTDTYEIDKRGYMLHREGIARLEELAAETQRTRQLEATEWYSLQDEQALDAVSNFLNENGDDNNQLGMVVFQRLYSAPWSTAHWLYIHQDSPLVPILSKEMKTIDKEVIDRVLEPVRDPDQNAFLKKLL